MPVGYVKLEDGRVAKHPDREVQSRIELIFEMLIEKQSVGKVVRFLNTNGLKVPRRSYTQRTGVEWQHADVPKVSEMVKNPIYAGAYVYGRRRKSPDKPGSRCSTVPRSEWQVCLQERRPAYISWDTFLRIEEMLHDNYAEYDRNKTRGIPRDGTALLHGIMYCGQCGHQMVVQYKGGTRYICNRLRQISPDVSVCQSLSADPIDQQVVQWFFEALSVAHIDIAQHTLQEADANHVALLASRRQQLTRLQYEVQLAERQYQQTDPDNRLVAAELENRWECALRELKAEEERQAANEGKSSCWAIPSELLDALKDVGPQLPEMWRQGLFTTPQKKKLLRSIVNKVVAYRVGGSQGARIHIRAVWRGGATTSGEVLVNVGKFSQLERGKEMEQRAVELSREGRTLADIARQLTEEGFRSPQSSHVLPSTVETIRLRRGVFQQNRSRPVHVTGYLTITELAKALHIRRSWFQEQIKKGAIHVEKDASERCYLFPDKKKTREDIRRLYQGKIDQLVY